MTRRCVVIGDVHGCADELETLLDKIALGAGDDVYLVGDLLMRGPHPRRTIDIAMQIGARSVLGNHEDRVLTGRSLVSEPLDEAHWAWLRALPLWLDVAAYGLRIIHGGLAPGLPIEAQDRDTLLYVRSIAVDGTPSRVHDPERLWGARYVGPPHVVFGHNAQPEPQIHPWATGLDTGCVYGGWLTALVLEHNQALPPPEERRSALVQVASQR